MVTPNNIHRHVTVYHLDYEYIKKDEYFNDFLLTTWDYNLISIIIFSAFLLTFSFYEVNLFQSKILMFVQA